MIQNTKVAPAMNQQIMASLAYRGHEGVGDGAYAKLVKCFVKKEETYLAPSQLTSTIFLKVIYSKNIYIRIVMGQWLNVAGNLNIPVTQN